MPDILSLPHNLDLERFSCRAVIETPAGSRAKFDLDPETGLFELAGMLPAGMAFPLDFGFVPSTLGEDGDPLDVLVLSEAGLPVGALLTVRLLGVIEAEQTERGEDGKANTCRNDRLIARLDRSHAHANVERLDQLGPAFAEDLKRFFETYNQLKGKKFDVLGIAGAERAAELIQNGSRKREGNRRAA